MVRPQDHWRRRATEAFTQRLALKGIALLLAVVLWFVVSAKEPTEAAFPVRFEPELDSSLVLRDPVPSIQALAAGPSRELFKLAVTPLVIRRHIDADAPDTLVVDLHPSDVEPPAGVAIQILDIQPRSIVLHFEATTTRQVPVRSAVSVAPAAAGQRFYVRFEPESVEVSGPRRTVARVGSVSTVRVVVPPDDSLPHLVDLDTVQMRGMRVRPTQVKVHIAIRGDSAAADSAVRADSARAPGPVVPGHDSTRPAAGARHDSLPPELTGLPVRPRHDSLARRARTVPHRPR